MGLDDEPAGPGFRVARHVAGDARLRHDEPRGGQEPALPVERLVEHRRVPPDEERPAACAFPAGSAVGRRRNEGRHTVERRVKDVDSRPAGREGRQGECRDDGEEGCTIDSEKPGGTGALLDERGEARGREKREGQEHLDEIVGIEAKADEGRDQGKEERRFEKRADGGREGGPPPHPEKDEGRLDDEKRQEVPCKPVGGLPERHRGRGVTAVVDDGPVQELAVRAEKAEDEPRRRQGCQEPPGGVCKKPRRAPRCHMSPDREDHDVGSDRQRPDARHLLEEHREAEENARQEETAR